MQIVVVGLNHKTAPLDVRERFAFTDDMCARALHQLVDRRTLREGIIVSTCNRVEVLATYTEAADLEDAVGHIKDFMSAHRHVAPDLLDDYVYVHAGAEAVRHLFRVAASLDSMVVGEPQILGQVRRAYALAHREGTAGRVLNNLVHTAFRVAKRVRTQTGIAASAVSIASVAVRLARQTFSSLEDRTVMLVGAGEMAEVALRHLIDAGTNRILIVNRTDDKARELAENVGGTAIPFSDFANCLPEADIVICSTTAYDYVVTPELAERAMQARDGRSAFYIDISVPRNVDPEVGDIENLFVFDLDDLQSVAATNQRKREVEAVRAEQIIDLEISGFQEQLRHLDLGPTVGALRQKLDQIAHDEYARQRSRLGTLTPEQEHAIQVMLASVVGKIAHPVIHRLRRSYDTGEAENVQVWRDIFGLEEQS